MFFSLSYVNPKLLLILVMLDVLESLELLLLTIFLPLLARIGIFMVSDKLENLEQLKSLTYF